MVLNKMNACHVFSDKNLSVGADCLTVYPNEGRAMSINQAIQERIKDIPAGQVFGYQELPEYGQSPDAVVKAVNRLVADKKIQRLSKGKFYIPKVGVLGLRKPSDSELIRSVIYKDGHVRGYITGLALFNRLGLTTQVPRTITIAINGGRQLKDFGSIRIKTVITRIPINEENIEFIQYLDVLKDVKKIPDADVNDALKIIKNKLEALHAEEVQRLVKLAVEFYSPQVRALLGLLYTAIKGSNNSELKNTLNPTTKYKLDLNSKLWPSARDWNIN
ncbi:type IV toxin-antitoxin system AbiEi family antitoxin domain-containing protein [Cellvibrio sp. QJXJ]|uniref:type IV toxin-antitoxin system AbiEi family antitoxin domain-containing protein n=1 Tax=Cellvibrio sp. QJXJ TaxID=2964606 RepID=UPI0021C446F3|nr:DUF6088 family protein [Cellvibrio sp. QJXJ]UUA74260.1 DUF6088 family protein [Cellvibrio sp. QJXJ]